MVFRYVVGENVSVQFAHAMNTTVTNLATNLRSGPFQPSSQQRVMVDAGEFLRAICDFSQISSLQRSKA